MAQITVKGSVTPAVGVLHRGEVATVTVTDRIKYLIARGYIVEVKDKKANPTPPKEPTTPAPTPEPTPITPEVSQGTNQDLVEATPIQGTDQTVPEVANPDVDNSLVDVSDPGTDAPTPTARTTKAK